MEILRLENISYRPLEKTILDNISLTIDEGDFIFIKGPSASGKSTLLKVMANLVNISSGKIYFRERDIEEINPIEYRKKVSYCLQNPILFRGKVWDNLNFPFYIRGESYDGKRVEELINSFNLDKSIIEEDVEKLSGGEKQRISLIRSLIYRPEILLLDEITSSLDEDNARLIGEVISNLNKEGLTILWVSHNLEEINRLSKRTIEIEGGRLINDQCQ